MQVSGAGKKRVQESMTRARGTWANWCMLLCSVVWTKSDAFSILRTQRTGFVPSAIERSVSLQLVLGTICRSTSALRFHWQRSRDNLRHICSNSHMGA